MARGNDVEIFHASGLSVNPDFGREWEALKVFNCPKDSGPSDQVYPSIPAKQWLDQVVQTRNIDVIHVMVSGFCNGMIAAAVDSGVPMVVTLLDFHYWCPTTLVEPNGGLCSGPKSLRECHRCVLKRHPRLSRVHTIWGQFPTWIKEQIVKFTPPSLAYIDALRKDLEQREHFFREILAPHAVFVAPSKSCGGSPKRTE